MSTRNRNNMKLEDVLTDKTISFAQKVPKLVTVWQRLQELINSSQSNSLERIIEWAQRHTLNLVLHGDWASQSEDLKDRLYTVVEDFDRTLCSSNKFVSRRCKKLIEVIKDPWGNATLCRILNEPDKCASEDELKFFASENGYLASMRLKKLCDSHCEDLALRFANACVRCLRLPESQEFQHVTTEDQKRYILDIYIALLHKYKRTHDIINEFKHFNLEEGLQLVLRFTNKRVELSRVWKYCLKIAELAAQFFMTAAMMKPVRETGALLADLLNAWVILNERFEGIDALPNIIRRIIQTADSAAHIYICCEVLNKQFGDNIKSFIIELYIRALTTDMNEMEKQKSLVNEEKVDEISKRLSSRFLSLADLLQDNLGVSRECVLTSFSLNPTESCLERLEKLAIACGKIKLKERTVKHDQNHPINLCRRDVCFLDSDNESSDTQEEPTEEQELTLDALILIKGDAVTGSKNYDVLSAPNHVLDAETLGLSPQLCDDLAVVLSSPRYQLLSWGLDWSELKSTCITYLQGHTQEGTRHTIKELKYLNIDYNQFKDWPSKCDGRPYTGIEKGYEQWIDEENSNASDFQLMDGQVYNDSDCSVTSTRGRPRRKVSRRAYSSESDYNSAECKATDSHGSDIDTASQDADSLGSDGLQHPSNQKTKCNNNSNLSFSTMIMNQSGSNPTLSSPNMMSLFGRLDETIKHNSISKASFQNPSLAQSFVLPEKRSSDPKVLKTLRMYRAKKKKEDQASMEKLDSAYKAEYNEDGSNYSLPSNMNPRVLLDRHDFNMLINKHTTKTPTRLEPPRGEDTRIKFLKQMQLDKINMNPYVKLNRIDDLKCKKVKRRYNKKSVCNTDYKVKKRRKLDVLADVPGLNTLEMIRPALIHPRVQVVQVAGQQSGQQTNQPPRAVKVQNNATTGTGTGTGPGSTSSSVVAGTPITAHIQRIGQPRTQSTTQATIQSVQPIIQSTIQLAPQSNSQVSSIQVAPQTTSQAISQAQPQSQSALYTSIDKNTSRGSDGPEMLKAAVSTDTSVGIAAPVPAANVTVTSVITSASASAITKPPNSQSTPTLVNILSQQIIRPAGTNSASTGRSSYINILSQQIIRPPYSQNSQKAVNNENSSIATPAPTVHSGAATVTTPITSTTTIPTQTVLPQNHLKPSSSNRDILQQIIGSQNKNSPIIKNVNIVTGISNSQSSVDTSRLIQFLCKTDGKMIQLTPYTGNTANIKLQSVDSKTNRRTSSSSSGKQTGSSQVSSQSPTQASVQLSAQQVNTQTGTHVATQAAMQTSTQDTSSSAPASPASSRSGYEENYAKFIQSSGKPNKNTTGDTNNSAEQANSLPKFQQAFGKAIVYQNNSVNIVDMPLTNANALNIQAPAVSAASTHSTTPASVNSTLVLPSPSLLTKSTNTHPTIPTVGNKNSVSPIGVQTIPGGVIYTRQVPVSLAVSAGQTINLIPNATVTQSGIGRNQVFRITSAAKDTVIRSKVNAFLAAAAIQNNSNRTSTTGATASATGAQGTTQTGDGATSSQPDVCEVDSSSSDSCQASVANATPAATPTLLRIVRPVLQIPSNMIQSTAAIRPGVVLTAARVPTVTTRTPQSQAAPQQTQQPTQQQPQPVNQNILAHNNLEPSVSSTTLEQLREFDLVLEQVKERSTIQPNSTPGSQAQAQLQVQPQAQPQVIKPVATLTASQAADLQEVLPGVNIAYVPQSHLTQKISPSTSVVVVTSYCSVQPAASPALSVTSQSSSSPCVTPAPSSSGSIGKTVPKSSAKSPKSKTVKATTTHTSKTSPVPKPQQKPQEDEQTTQRIFDILAEYAEQLRNSPDLNNKPAPRRRSNPPTNPNQSSKRKKSSAAKKVVTGQCNSATSELSPGAEDPRTMGSEDSSCGVVQISVQDSPSRGTASADDHHTLTATPDFSSVRNQQQEQNESTMDTQLPTTSRQFIFTDTNTNQPRNVIIADSAVSEALVGKIANTAAVIVPANYIVPMVKGTQQIAVVSGNSKILATVPARSGSNMLLFQSFVNSTRRPVAAQNKSVKYPTIQTIQGISSQALSGVSAQPPVVLPSTTETVKLPQSLAFKKADEGQCETTKSETVQANTELLLSAAATHTYTTPSTTSLDTSDTPNVSKVAHAAQAEAETASSSTSTHSDSTETKLNNQTRQLEIGMKVLPLCSTTLSSESNDLKLDTNTNIKNNFTINYNSKSTISNVIRPSIVEHRRNSDPDETNVEPNMSPDEMMDIPPLSMDDKAPIHKIDLSRLDLYKGARARLLAQLLGRHKPEPAYDKEKKSQSNTNGPMLAQQDVTVAHRASHIDSGKQETRIKVARELDEGSAMGSYSCTKYKKMQGNQRAEKELQAFQQRKQAALERELRLQKSLSEECEDLGVDEPSTSDLFPEADLLFDSNNSPSFDQLSQDVDKRYSASNFQLDHSSSSSEPCEESCNQPKNKSPSGSKVGDSSADDDEQSPVTDICRNQNPPMEQSLSCKKNKEENKGGAITMFSDDDNSNSTLRADLLFSSLSYPSGHFDYENRLKSQQHTNGSKDGLTMQSNTSNYSGSSYEEHTLMTTCASVSDASSPMAYDINSPPSINKLKYKYSNKKLLNSENTETPKNNDAPWHQTEVIELSSDDDSSCSGTTESDKSSDSDSSNAADENHKQAGTQSRSRSWNARQDDEDSRSSYKNYKILKLASNMKMLMDPSLRFKRPPCSSLKKAANTPPSPLSPADGELGSLSMGRGTRRSTQRTKKNCMCCTSSDEKPKKRPGISKKQPKGPPAKKR